MANDETVCWQCGAPADPGCVYTQNLEHRADYADGLGHQVKRGRFGKSFVKVAVPRCEACQLRNYLFGFLSVIGFLAGACVGGMGFPSSGITTIVGGVCGLAPVLLIGWYYRRARGLKPLSDYPPLKQLRAAGWEEPG